MIFLHPVALGTHDMPHVHADDMSFTWWCLCALALVWLAFDWWQNEKGR